MTDLHNIIADEWVRGVGTVENRSPSDTSDLIGLSAQACMAQGHALANGQRGPVVSAAQLASNLAFVNLARQEGCTVACGGGRLSAETDGFDMSPTVLTGTRNAIRVSQEEMFAPIACVTPAADLDDAIALANDTRFGLTAGIATRSLARATRFRRASRSGCVMVNLPIAGTDYHVPFGGTRASSYGPREQGRYAVDFYPKVKTSYVHAGEAT